MSAETVAHEIIVLGAPDVMVCGRKVQDVEITILRRVLNRYIIQLGGEIDNHIHAKGSEEDQLVLVRNRRRSLDILDRLAGMVFSNDVIFKSAHGKTVTINARKLTDAHLVTFQAVLEWYRDHWAQGNETPIIEWMLHLMSNP